MALTQLNSKRDGPRITTCLNVRQLDILKRAAASLS